MTSPVVKTVLIALLSLSLFCISCSTNETWTEEEKQNFRHYINSAEADILVAQLINQAQPFSSMSKETAVEILRLRRYALEQAKLVSNDVLEKALSGLSQPYRELYQRSLELQIKNFAVGDVSAEIEGSRLHDQWVDWINPRQPKIRVPR